MEEYKITLPAWLCLRCGHKWPAQAQEPPMVCPKCRSPYWKTKRKSVVLKGMPEPGYAVIKTKVEKIPIDELYGKSEIETQKPAGLRYTADRIELLQEESKRIIAISTPQHIPQKDITPDNQDEIQKECFLCAKDLNFDCQARIDLVPVKDLCNACFRQEFWGSTDMYKDMYDMTPEAEIKYEEAQDPNDLQRLKKIAYECKFKMKYPNKLICPNKDRGRIVNEACTYCWELEELWGTEAAGYEERRKK